MVKVKKLSIVVFCLIIGIFLSTLSYSQDDPATTDSGVTVTDTGGKEGVATEKVSEENTVVPADAKVFHFSGTTFVNAKVLFKLTARDNVMLDKIMYKIDNGEFQAYQNTFAIDVEGTHVISYYGVDKIGNQEDTKIFRVIVDTTAPEIDVTTNTPVIKANGKYFISKNFTFNINTYDTLSGVNKVDYVINGEAKEYTGPFSFASEGDVELKVSAVDNVNNKNEQFVINVVDDRGKAETLRDVASKLSVDNTAPDVLITPNKDLPKTEDNKTLAASDVRYAVSATDKDSGVSSIQVRVDGVGDFTPYVNEVKFRSNGEHMIEAKAIDRVGNVSEVKSLAVFVDTIAPQTRINTIPE